MNVDAKDIPRKSSEIAQNELDILFTSEKWRKYIQICLYILVITFI